MTGGHIFRNRHPHPHGYDTKVGNDFHKNLLLLSLDVFLAKKRLKFDEKSSPSGFPEYAPPGLMMAESKKKSLQATNYIGQMEPISVEYSELSTDCSCSDKPKGNQQFIGN
jgi:hypothetical protein